MHLVISDIHEHEINLNKALNYAQSHGIKSCLVLGDLINPGVFRKIAESKMQIYLVFGNNDGDKFSYFNVAKTFNNLNLGDIYLDTIINNKRVFLSHYPHLAQDAFATNKYSACFHGHNHQYKIIKNSQNLLMNPGELCGVRTGVATFGIWDGDENNCQIIAIKADQYLKLEVS